jgi:ElaB/YqjD/DUF883 family membrane-anchored ribosome-binding protein
MPIFISILFVIALGFAIFLLVKNKKLEEEVIRINDWAQIKTDEAQKSAEQRVVAIEQQARDSIAEAQSFIDQQLAEVQKEGERVKTHYQLEARKIQEAADALVSKTIQELEPLRKYEKIRDAETEAKNKLAQAITEATSLRAEAQTLLESAKNVVESERKMAVQRVKDMREQAEALLNQATKDAGRIIAAAEKKAEEIGGDAYLALRDKQIVEQAAVAMRNIIEGYGDRYIVPTH